MWKLKRSHRLNFPRINILVIPSYNNGGVQHSRNFIFLFKFSNLTRIIVLLLFFVFCFCLFYSPVILTWKQNLLWNNRMCCENRMCCPWKQNVLCFVCNQQPDWICAFRLNTSYFSKYALSCTLLPGQSMSCKLFFQICPCWKAGNDHRIAAVGIGMRDTDTISYCKQNTVQSIDWTTTC